MKKNILVQAFSLAAALLLLACGSGGKGSSGDSGGPGGTGGTGGTIAVTSVSLDQKTLALGLGAKATLAATVLPANATNKAVTWSSSDASVASVSATGEVSGLKVGTATITVSTVDGGKTDTCALTVTQVSSQGVVISVSPLQVVVPPGGSVTFLSAVTGTGNTTATWSVVETGGGTINASTGRYTAPAATGGLFHVKATSAADATKSAQATIIVGPADPLPAISVSPGLGTVKTGGSQQYSASVVNLADQRVTWSVDEAGGGTITAAGLYAAPPTPGTYHVRATSSANPALSGATSINVIRNGGTTPGTAVVVVKPASGVVRQRGSFAFSAEVVGIANSKVLWSVVDANGNPLPTGGMIDDDGGYMALDGTPGSSQVDVAPGTYTIRARALGDIHKAYGEATITVTPDSGPWVSVAPSTLALRTGEQHTFTAAVEGSANQGVDWLLIESGSGSFNAATGTYTAPGTPGLYHLRATSKADPSRTFDAEILVEPPPVARYFEEKFTWKGNHAAFVGKSNGHPGRGGTTVWWNEDNWEVRGDNENNAAPGAALDSNSPTNTPNTSTGHHLDIHKAQSADPTVGMEDNSVAVPGGDGSTGMGIMRIDYQGKLGARLRNPVLLDASRPVLVEFYATRFVTEGHWWEVAFTDASQPLFGQELTAVPSGVGTHPSEDSVNVVGIGFDHYPCFQTGWSTIVPVHSVLGADQADAVDPNHPMPTPYLASSPEEQDTLKHWRIQFWPDRVLISLDENDTDDFKTVNDVKLDRTVPWKEAYVTLMGVGYQTDHHPGDECWQGIVRELVWRNVKIGPVKYDHTTYAPRNEVARNVQRETGWMNYDRRDMQRIGAPVTFQGKSYPQANAAPIGWGSYAFGSESLPGGPSAAPTKTLTVTLTQEQADSPWTRLVYDRMDLLATDTDALPATLTVNGKLIGNLPSLNELRINAHPGYGGYIHRSITIPAGTLKAGTNTFVLAMSGKTVFDGLHLEFGHP